MPSLLAECCSCEHSALQHTQTVCGCAQKLLLMDNNLQDLGTAGSSRGWLRQLTELDLSNNLFAAVPPALTAATALRQLHMQRQNTRG